MNNWDHFHLNADFNVTPRRTIFGQRDDELTRAVEVALALNPHFWELLYGIDAYQELRRRRLRRKR